jgi:hypothetical protein
MRVRWPFDRDNDRAVLTEGTEFLQHVSGTLVELTLEDRYLGFEGAMRSNRMSQPGKGGEAGYPEDSGGAWFECVREEGSREHGTSRISSATGPGRVSSGWGCTVQWRRHSYPHFPPPNGSLSYD